MKIGRFNLISKKLINEYMIKYIYAYIKTIYI